MKRLFIIPLMCIISTICSIVKADRCTDFVNDVFASDGFPEIKITSDSKIDPKTVDRLKNDPTYMKEKIELNVKESAVDELSAAKVDGSKYWVKLERRKGALTFVRVDHFMRLEGPKAKLLGRNEMSFGERQGRCVLTRLELKPVLKKDAKPAIFEHNVIFDYENCTREQSNCATLDWVAKLVKKHFGNIGVAEETATETTERAQ